MTLHQSSPLSTPSPTGNVVTIKANVSSILSKLDLDNRTQIALLAPDAD
jgi:hypothetical protein